MIPRTKQRTVRINPVCLHPAECRQVLDEGWTFRLDPEDRGLAEGWAGQPDLFADPIAVPGCWQGQGFGHDGVDECRDFGLRARVFRATYRGTGWYCRRFAAPAAWRNKRIWVHFGGVHPTARVWLDGEPLGENHLPFAPFGFELTGRVTPGQEHILTVRVSEEDRLYGLAYSWQGNWSGLYRGVELSATGPTCLQSLELVPDGQEKRLTVRAGVDGKGGDLSLRLRLAPWTRGAGNGEGGPSWTLPIAGTRLDESISVATAEAWTPDHPRLYRVDAELRQGRKVLEGRSERIGFVDLTQRDRHFRINGEPYYIRGTGEFTPYPETGSPDTDRERWRRKLQALRDYGYNQVRCQSYAPPPEYLDAADEVGLLIQSELGTLGAWGGNTKEHIYAWPQPNPLYRSRLRAQWNAVVRRDLHHPSANMYCMSNELGNGTFYPRTAWRCYRETKAIKPSALVLWTDGGHNDDLPEEVTNDSSARLQANPAWQPDRPLIEHEFRWWSSYPDVRTMAKYQGAVRPYGAELALRAAAAQGLSHILPAAAANSQRLQAIEAKGKLEALRRDQSSVIAGVSHFNAMDTNPSPQGVLDEFFQPKTVTPEDWLQVNGDVAVLCSLDFDDRCLAAGEARRIELFVSDYAHPPLRRPRLRWSLQVGGEEVHGGRITWSHEPHTACAAGSIEVQAPDLPTPRQARLQVELSEGKRRFGNGWDLWVFPPAAPLPTEIGRFGRARHTWICHAADIPAATARELRGAKRPKLVLTERLSPALVRYLQAGGRVLLAASEGLVRPMHPKLGLTRGRYFFTPPANYGPFEEGQNGTIVQPHAMLGDFPHEGFADLQMYRMVAESPPLELGALHLGTDDPVIRMLHHYTLCRPLGYLAECAVGEGVLVLSALDLNPAWPEAAWLLGQVCRYLTGDALRPESALSDAGLSQLVEGTAL